VSNVLDCCKLKAGKLTLELQPVEIGMFVRKLTGVYRQLAGAKGLRFQARIDANVPPVIMTDGLRLQQILGNLLANAVKFTATGSVELAIEAGPAARGPRVRFHVRDTGLGIPADKLARLFQPYQQADNSTARQFGGSGLGLCIARELARLLKGDITVHSIPGSGSTFTVEIEAPPLPGL
jgi:signal transduction histidine kinase